MYAHIGKGDVGSICVGVGKNGDCFDTHEAACAHDAQGNFAAISDEEGLDITHD